jgi:hypothetical protein
MEKPGFDKTNMLLPIRLSQIQMELYQKLERILREMLMIKAIVLNKLNFQSETNLSSDMNFNHFFEINK